MFETTEGTGISAAMPQPRCFQGNIMRALVSAVLLLLASVSFCWADDQAKRLLSLVDYIGGDYRNAVQGGQVINRDEYQEMSEFAARSLELFNQLKANESGDKANIEKDLRTLATHIKNRSGEDLVPHLAQQIKDRLVKTYGIATFPKAIPTYDSAKAIYHENCAQCHGASGRGDGPGAGSMRPKEPKPANFTDPNLINQSLSFQSFQYDNIRGSGDGHAKLFRSQ